MEGAKSTEAETNGFWYPHTATLDWCEQNYGVTVYIVEFWNCISSLLFPLLAVYAGIQSWRRGRFAKRFIIAYVCLGVVGIGSALFHGTLQYHWQLSDELPMIWGAAQQVYCLIPSVVSLIVLSLLSFWFTYSYVFVHRNAIVHEVLFAALEFAFVVIYLWRLLKMPRTRRVHAQRLLAGGFVFNLMGAIVWVLDNRICHHLVMGKGVLGPVFSVLLELHAWWHILSSLGVLWLMSGGCVLSYESRGVRVGVEYHVFGLLPVLKVAKHNSKLE